MSSFDTRTALEGMQHRAVVETEDGAPSQTTETKTSQTTTEKAQASIEEAILKQMAGVRSMLEPPATPPPSQDGVIYLAKTTGEMLQRLEAKHAAELEGMQRRFDEKLAKLEQLSKAPTIITSKKSGDAFFDDFAQRVLDDPMVQHYLGKGMEPRDCRVNVPCLMELFDKRDTLGAEELGAHIAPTYRPGIVEWKNGRYELARAIRRTVCKSDSYIATIEPEASGKAYVKSNLDAAIEGDPTPTNTCTLKNSTGFEKGMWVRFLLSGSTPRRRIVSVDHETLTFAADDLNFDAPDEAVVVCEAIGTSAEKARKPESYAALTPKSSPLQTIGFWVAVTQQRIWAMPELPDWLKRKLYTKYVEQLSWHLLYGNGLAHKELDGFFNESGHQSYVWSAGDLNDTMTDAVFKAMRMIPSGTGAVFMNNWTWWDLQLEKDPEGRYIHNKFGRYELIPGEWGTRRIGEFLVGIDDNIIPGTVLNIDLTAASELPYNPDAAQFLTGTVAYQLIENERTHLYEEHCAHSIQSLQAFVEVTLDEAPSA